MTWLTGLTGLEPQPEACNAHRCTVDEVIKYEDIWIQEVDPTGHKYNITSCKRERVGKGWCNQTGNAHGAKYSICKATASCFSTLLSV